MATKVFPVWTVINIVVFEPTTVDDSAIITGDLAKSFGTTIRPADTPVAMAVVGVTPETINDPVTVAVTVTVTVFASQTIGPVAVTVGVAVVKFKSATLTI